MADVIVNGEYRDFRFPTDCFEDAGYWLLEGYGDSMGLVFSYDDDLYGWVIPEEDFPKWEARARLYANLAQDSVPEDLYEVWDEHLRTFDCTDDCDRDLIQLAYDLINVLTDHINDKEA